jgi:hypothetical protein
MPKTKKTAIHAPQRIRYIFDGNALIKQFGQKGAAFRLRKHNSKKIRSPKIQFFEGVFSARTNQRHRWNKPC